MILRALIFLLATAAAGAAAWLSMQAGSNGQVAEVRIETEQMPTVDVLVASADISSGEVLSPDMLRWTPWPEQTVNARLITRTARPNAQKELAGTFVNSAFIAGEPISDARLMAVNRNLMSNKIESGKRAAAVKVSAASAAGGFILPGDRVDVIHTTASANADGQATLNKSRIIISNARVLAIDQTSAQTPEGTVLGKTATLELTPADAERIMAAEASGMLSLTLRSVSDHADETPLRDDRPARTVMVHRGGENQTVTID